MVKIRGLQSESNYTRFTQIIIQTLERSGRLQTAQKLYQHSIAQFTILAQNCILQLHPNAAAYHTLAKAYLQQERWQDAVCACQQAIDQSPQSPWFYHTLGKAYAGQGESQKAIQSYQQAIDLDPQVGWFHYDLGKVFLAQENWQAAIDRCHRAIVLDPHPFWFHYTLGEAFVKSGQWAKAIVTLRHAIDLNPAFPWSYYHLGDALLVTEAIDAAITVYRQAVQLRPGNPYINQSLHYALHLQQQQEKITAYIQQRREGDRAQNHDQNRGLNILILTPYTPYPPRTGAVARMFHQIKHFSLHHHVVVVSLMFSRADYVFESELETDCDLAIMVANGDFLPPQPHQPKLVHRYSSQRLRKILTQLQPIEFDIVSYQFVYMAQYADLFPNAFNILEEHNIESELLRRSATVQQNNSQFNQLINQLTQQTNAVNAFIGAESEAKLLAAYEDQIWQRFPLRTVVSERDRQLLDHRCSTGKTIVIQNGIDTAAVTPVGHFDCKTLLFMGTLSYYPNIDGVCFFVETILPLIWQRDPTLQICIAGSQPPQQIRALDNQPRITVIADPADMMLIAQNCAVSIVPLRVGSGTRIKILHAMSLGLPVVSTALGCEGLAVEDGVHLLVRDRPAAFAEAVLQLVNDETLWRSIRQQGRILVEREYNWQQINQQAEQQTLAHFQAWQTVQSDVPLSSPDRSC